MRKLVLMFRWLHEGHYPGLPGPSVFFLWELLGSRPHLVSISSSSSSSCSHLPTAWRINNRQQGSYAVSQAELSTGHNWPVHSSKPLSLPEGTRDPFSQMLYFQWFCHWPPVHTFQQISVTLNSFSMPMEGILIANKYTHIKSGFSSFSPHPGGLKS